jgi:hypothetical protein
MATAGDEPAFRSGRAGAEQRPLPPIPGTSWIVRVLVPAGDIWRAEKRIRALDALPAIGDPLMLEGEAPGRVAGVCSPAMSGVHADIYVAPDAAQ